MFGIDLDSMVSGRSFVELNWLCSGGRGDERRRSCWLLKDRVVRPVDGREETPLVKGMVENSLFDLLIHETKY